MQGAVPKQYVSLLGRPVIRHTLECLCAHAQVRGAIVGIATEDRHWPGLATTLKHLSKLLGTFIGGATRARTVLNGLHALAARAKANDWVMVHDAVRPCLRSADIDRLITAVGNHADGGLLGLPVSDTVKRVGASGLVTETIARADLWRALTPQLFRFDNLERALRQALTQGTDVTDEAAAIEAAGGHPIVVQGHADNIKITVPEDLPLAELFLRQQGRA